MKLKNKTILNLNYTVCKPQPIMLNFVPTYYSFEQCSKMPIMLNIMPMTPTIMPQFVYDFMIFNDLISIVRLQINFYLLF